MAVAGASLHAASHCHGRCLLSTCSESTVNRDLASETALTAQTLAIHWRPSDNQSLATS